jgi:hypothetical protein
VFSNSQVMEVMARFKTHTTIGGSPKRPPDVPLLDGIPEI